ncbi:MAG: phasin family protein [Pleurocapsa sp.]
MPGFEDIAKKAFYMGVGFASYAQEKANDNFKDLRIQAQNLADEMVERGKMSTDEARKFVDDLVEQAQQGAVVSGEKSSESREPRKIEIVDEDEQPKTTPQPEVKIETDVSSKPNSDNSDLRQQVESLKEELRRLKKEM